jgi:integrase
MPRQTEDQAITTRAARGRLTIRHEPYWRGIGDEVSVGYRKSTTGGLWFARVRLDGKYRKTSLGRADDGLAADGTAVLDYSQAMAGARAWATRQHRIEAGQEDAGAASYTVAMALLHYIEDYRRRGGKALADTRRAIDAHILPALGTVMLARLTRQRVKRWHDGLADAPARLRTSRKPGSAQRHREAAASDLDARRARRATANRILTVLKAALNHARQNGKVASDEAWALVKPFKAVDAPRVRFLDEDETARLLAACPDDVRQIVTAGLLTGMRYGEIIRLQVADFHADARTISLSDSKSGKPRLVHLTDEGAAFFAQAAASKGRSALLFTHPDGTPWQKSHQFRPLRQACTTAEITPAISFHGLRHTYASRLVMRGVSMSVVAAQLGDSEAITAKHYAHLAPAYVADAIRGAFGTLGVIARAGSSPLAKDTLPG